ncbi:hypothetical protein ACFWYW_46920 [Nonomuraea sp. NPDC059023]|uniref:hypothetical protein n=1 Tax=unclassified Nonomuraea TaxID=2593643 RepID=UPI00368B7A8F
MPTTPDSVYDYDRQPNASAWRRKPDPCPLWCTGQSADPCPTHHSEGDGDGFTSLFLTQLRSNSVLIQTPDDAAPTIVIGQKGRTGEQSKVRLSPASANALADVLDNLSAGRWTLAEFADALRKTAQLATGQEGEQP